MAVNISLFNGLHESIGTACDATAKLTGGIKHVVATVASAR
jgi:hypothetical protein